MSDELDQLSSTALHQRATSGALRSLTPVEPIGGMLVRLGGRELVNFCSNAYLGLHAHPRVIEAANLASQRYGTGSAASALITGFTPIHDAAQRAIAQWKGAAACVLAPSGYQANVACVQTLAALAQSQGRRPRFILDKLVHASVLDAVRSTEAAYRIFPHNKIDKLRRLLAQADPQDVMIVITESIFSMDGDAADLAGIAAIKKEQRFILVLDEAHASGIYGECGSGLANEMGLAGLADVSIVTLSKALGASGGAICGTEPFCQAVVNFGRAIIYSTNLPASSAAAAMAAIDVLSEEPWRAQRVRALARRVRAALALDDGDSPIIPVMLGSAEAALEAAGDLQERGLYVAAVRPPTVAPGKSRLRVTLSSEHTDEQVERLIVAVQRLRA